MSFTMTRTIGLHAITRSEGNRGLRLQNKSLNLYKDSSLLKNSLSFLNMIYPQGTIRNNLVYFRSQGITEETEANPPLRPLLCDPPPSQEQEVTEVVDVKNGMEARSAGRRNSGPPPNPVGDEHVMVCYRL